MVAAFAFSEDEPTAINRAKQKGLLFTMTGLGDFGVSGNLLGIAVPTSSASSQKLAGLGMKYYLSNKIAIRGALHLGWAQTETQSAAGSLKTTTTIIGIAPGMEYHFLNTKAVSAYFGGAAAAGVYNSTNPSSYDAMGNPTVGKVQGMIYSLAFLLGAEFFLAENISLGAEYQIAATSTSGKTEAGTSSKDFPKTLNLGINSIAATLAIYW